MPRSDRNPEFSTSRRAAALLAFASVIACPASAQPITALPDQTSAIRLSNRDVNHIVCSGGEIEDVKFSAEKGLAVERSGADAWIKFLVKEVEELGAVTRTYVTTPSEFFISCNGAVYPLYAEPSDIPAQTVILAPGMAHRARANEALLGPLVEEERAVSITLAMLQDRVPASFAELAPAARDIVIPSLPAARLQERRRFAIEGAGLWASEYLVEASADMTIAEREFLVSALGANIFALTLDRFNVKAGETARLIVIRKAGAQ
jgi:conjugal transfer pilus assembly protein TraK